jgi:hypothetical protein
MKTIQSKNFLKKQAQFRDFNLPPGTTDQMVDNQFGSPESKSYPNQSGEYEAKVDWVELTRELVNAGYDVGSLPYFGQDPLYFYYEFDAEVSNGDVNILDIRLLDIKILRGSQYQPLTVSTPETKEAIFNGYKDEIASKEKATIQELDASSVDRGPDHRPLQGRIFRFPGVVRRSGAAA